MFKLEICGILPFMGDIATILLPELGSLSPGTHRFGSLDLPRAKQHSAHAAFLPTQALHTNLWLQFRLPLTNLPSRQTTTGKLELPKWIRRTKADPSVNTKMVVP